ncbi:MAG: RnfABCDGE type electron transport complex subunit D [Candidatus Bathyarchaeota archaeon]|nr:RnfABCDGE type electron transport complex subunit D [Candidatus Bathyarchaeota archaeon]
MSQTKEYSIMTKDRLMTYTFIALLAVTIVSAIIWWPVTPQSPMFETVAPINLGLTLILCALISVGVAVGIDVLFAKLVSDSQLNIMSAAVFGLIVTDSYTLGLPLMATEAGLPVDAPGALIYVALISMVGMVLFKKVANMAGRKYVNPAAAAKFLVFLPGAGSVLIAANHLNIGMELPRLAGKITAFGSYDSFATFMSACFGNPNLTTQPDLAYLMIVEKFHGWAGGACSIAVIIAGLALFVVARRYIKWRITLAYFVSIAAMSLILSFVYADVDLITRLLWTVFIGSSIFLGFFMATDPATTPVGRYGQIIFGVGLGVLTVLIQTYMNFFGGSLLALLIMNLLTPKIDGIGRLKPMEGGKEPSLPKAKKFDKIKTYPCMRCGACMSVCCNKLSPILIKQARDKQDMKTLLKLDADFCAGCGNCNFICPSRIDLKSNLLNTVLTAEDEETIEQSFLIGNPDENIGVYKEMFSAKSKYEGQDGGMVTALLISGMEKGIFDSAIVVKKTKGYLSEAYVAESAEDIIQAKGTKYMRVRLMSKVGELIAKGKRKIAVVGTPCEIRAARRVQQAMMTDVPDLELTMIGLFCFENFEYPKLKEEIKTKLGVDLDAAEKTQISKGKFIVTVDGKDSAIAVKELSSAVENMCLSCPDFSSKFADISVGSVGSEAGKSTVIVRSSIGEQLVEGLDITKSEAKLEEVSKLSVLKKNRAEKTVAGESE